MGVCAAALSAHGVVPAIADPARAPDSGPSFPSQRHIDDARVNEQAARDAVGRAEQRLAAINAELDEAYVAMGKAVEAYNGAEYALTEAKATEAAAQKEARRTAAEAKRAREVLGQVVAASYRQGGELARVGVILSAEDGEALYDSFAAFRSVTDSQAGAYRRAAETTAAAEQAAATAQSALAERQRATKLAKQMYQEAERLVAGHEGAAAAAEAERQNLLGELAAARGITVQLEEARQQAIAEQEAAERERRARENHDDEDAGGENSDSGQDTDRPDERERDREQPDGDDRDGDEPGTESRPTPTPSETPKPTPTPTKSPTETPKPSPTPTPSPPPPPDPPSGADAAIAYARQQLGKPYEWGAKGPDSFDCSGLTMRAWEAGGKSLLPWSGGQAEQARRVSYSDLRPGDLVFWSDNGQASGVYHVGLYIGDSQMIHAPRPGTTVEVQNIWYWIDPAFYGRVT